MDTIISIVIALAIMVYCILMTIEIWQKREIHKLMIQREKLEQQKQNPVKVERFKLHHDDSHLNSPSSTIH